MAKTICFDFDGVLAEYDKWRGHAIIGKPIEENIELVRRLHREGNILILCTTRLNDYPFVDKPDKKDESVVNGFASEFLRHWLKDQGILECFSVMGCKKLFADYYIDDRALRYGLEKDFKGTLTGQDLYQILLNKEVGAIPPLDESRGILAPFL